MKKKNCTLYYITVLVKFEVESLLFDVGGENCRGAARLRESPTNGDGGRGGSWGY